MGIFPKSLASVSAYSIMWHACLCPLSDNDSSLEMSFPAIANCLPCSHKTANCTHWTVLIFALSLHPLNCTTPLSGSPGVMPAKLPIRTHFRWTSKQNSKIKEHQWNPWMDKIAVRRLSVIKFKNNKHLMYKATKIVSRVLHYVGETTSVESKMNARLYNILVCLWA